MRKIQRREVLAGIGTAGLLGIAGCAEEEPDNGEPADTPTPEPDEEIDPVDSVMVVGFPQSGIQIFRDYYAEFADDYPDLDIIVPDGLIDSELPVEVDNPMNNVIGTEPAAAGPGAEFFADLYEDTYDTAPGVFNSHAYDAMAVSVLASVAAGDHSGPEIRDRMRTVANPNGEEFGPESLPEAVEAVAAGDAINFQGASSSVNFDVNGDMSAVSYNIVDFRDGELETIDTVPFDVEGPEGEAPAEDPVGVDSFEAMVGVLMPETGDLGPLGGPIRDAALLAATQINDADLNVTVETSVEDTQTDPQVGISGAESLVGAGYPIVVGPASSVVNFQVIDQVYLPNAVVGISPSSTAPEVTDLEDDGFIFRTAPSDALQGPVMAEIMYDQFDAQSTSTLFLNDDYGQALEESYAAAFEDFTGDVRSRVSFEPEQPSYSAQWADVLEG